MPLCKVPATSPGTSNLAVTAPNRKRFYQNSRRCILPPLTGGARIHEVMPLREIGQRRIRFRALLGAAIMERSTSATEVVQSATACAYWHTALAKTEDDASDEQKMRTPADSAKAGRKVSKSGRH